MIAVTDCLDDRTFGTQCEFHDYYILPIPFSPLTLTSATSYPYIGDTDESHTQAIPIPFPFRFYDKYYTQLYVGTNGWIKFGDEPTNSDDVCDSGQVVPRIVGRNGPLSILAFYWADIEHSNVQAQFVSDPLYGSRLVINFFGGDYYTCASSGLEGTCPVVNVQIHLLQDLNQFEVHYLDLYPNPKDMFDRTTISIESTDVRHYTVYEPFNSLQGPTIYLNGTALLFSTDACPCISRLDRLVRTFPQLNTFHV